jgi:TRAP-type C4-dicarboxylate transport system substrate-binding protein
MRRVGRWLITVVATVLALPALGVPVPTGSTAAFAADPVVIRAITAWPLDCNCVSQYKRYIEEVNRRGKGTVEIKLLGGPEVVAAFEQFRALRSGIADMTHTAGGYFVGETIEGSVMDLLDPNDFAKYLKGLRGTRAADLMNQAYREKSQMRFLGIMVGGTGFRFLMTKPVASLDDLRGKRIRVFGTQGAKAVQFLGASPQTIPANELYPALQRGVVDGALRAPDDAWSFGERDVYKGMLDTPLQLAPGGAFVAVRVWDKLPAGVQQLLSTVAVELEPQVLDYFAKADAKAIESLKANGMNVAAVGDAERRRLAEARTLYWEDIVGKSPTLGAQLRSLLEPYSR